MMRYFTIRNVARCAVLSAFSAAFLMGAEVRGAYIATLTESGGDLVATGSGTINTAGLTFRPSQSGGDYDSGYILPFAGYLGIGPTTLTQVDKYSGITGPDSFGTSHSHPNATSGSGDMVFLGEYFHVIDVPLHYVSGTPLSGTSTFSGQSFASLGITPGTYVWTWGSGNTADSYTLKVGQAAAVPLPSAFSMAGTSMLVGFGCVLWNRRKAKLAT